MPNKKDLEIALRIKADLAEGQRAVQDFSDSIEKAGVKAESSFTKANETADQQAARIKEMVAASLAHRDAMSEQAELAERSGAAAGASSSNWQSVAAAQTAAARAATKYAAAEAKAAASAGKAADGIDREGQELAELLGRIDPVIRKLDELDDMEQRLRASRKSGALDAETFDVFNGKLQAQRAALTGSDRAMHAATITAGQYRQAMRQLPAQITDITTSLASGMPIWLVAVQQGGQIKDSFGGIGNASRALLKSINPLSVGIAAVAGAVVAAGVAWYQGSQEVSQYNQALILTGNISGTTADAMSDMAARIDGISGTQRQAAAALAEIAREGKFTEEQLEQIGLTAVLMENTIGRAVSATVDEFRQLTEDPTKGVENLNDQYHFLTLAVYQQIAALQEEGKEVEAVQLAIDTLTKVQNQRMEEIEENLGYVESAWKGVKNIASETWDAMLGLGRDASLSDLEAELEELENRPSSRSNVGAKRERELRAEIARRKAEAEQKKEAARQQKIQDDAIDAEKRIQKARLDTLTKAEKREKAIAKYREDVEAINAAAALPGSDVQVVSAEQQAKDIANIKAKYADKEAKTQSSAYANLNRQITERIAMLNAANEAEQKLTDTQRFSEKVLASLEANTQKFTATQQEAIRAQLATLAAADQANQKRADDKSLESVQQRLLANQGQQAAAAAIQLEAQYGDLLKRLEARGDTAGADLVNNLIDVETARARLGELQSEIDRVFSERARGEVGVQAQIESGLLTEIEGRRKIVELHQQSASELAKLLPELERVAEITKDPAIDELLDNLRAKIEETKNVASEMELAFQRGFEGGLSNSIQELAKGTQNLEEAARSFVNAIAESMLRFSADAIAQQAFSGLKGIFSDMTAGAAQAQVAMESVKTTKIATDTAMLASSEATLATQTATSAAAAAETTAAWTPAATAASIGSFGTAAAIGLAAVVAALAFKAFAEGGHVRGPGTKTSDSIPALLSDQEFVTRAAVVTQPGALNFLEDFNRRGMVALQDWSGVVRHATGGLAGVPAPDAPAPMLQTTDMPAAAGNTTLKNSQEFYLVDDPQRIADSAFNSRQGREAFYIMLGQNPGKIRSLLNIKG